MRIRSLAMLTTLATLLGAAPATQPTELPLYPHLIPTTTETSKERGTTTRPDRSLSRVTLPTLTLYLPDPAHNTGTAAIICPGGGYSALAIDHEGHDIARWLNTLGVTGIVLKYRLPHYPDTAAGEPYPIADVHEALRQTRARATAKSWPINPDRIGIIGFSAGGHLASTAATHFTPETRPDFAILGYPVITMHAEKTHAGSRKNLLGPTPTPELEALYSNEEQITPNTPPIFLFHAKDDHTVPIENSEWFAAACKKANVPVELHEYERGGHGFGLGKGESAAWPAQCETWLRNINLLAP